MDDAKKKTSRYLRLKILAVFLSLGGAALFIYILAQVGLSEIWEGVGKVGVGGFLLVFFIYGTRLGIRSLTWSLSVEHPYVLKFRDSSQAVVIGEAMSSLIPLSIIVSGTTKALAVRNRLPLVASLSALAVENLFYSLATGLLIVVGAFTLIFYFDLPEYWFWMTVTLVSLVTTLVAFGIVIIIRQWRFASAAAKWLYRRGILRRWLETGRSDIRIFENRIYGFYRRQPKRFPLIFGLQVLFHTLGALEVWLILFLIGENFPSAYSAFLLESVTRAIIVLFKMIPFMLGIEEAAAQFVTDILKLGGGLGVALAIVRKGMRISWATIGVLLLAKRGLSIKEAFQNSRSIEQEKLSHQTQ